MNAILYSDSPEEPDESDPLPFLVGLAVGVPRNRVGRGDGAGVGVVDGDGVEEGTTEGESVGLMVGGVVGP